MDIIEQLEELVGKYCAGGYANGFIGEANANWCRDNYPALVGVGQIYRLGTAGYVLKGVENDTPGVAELVEILQGLSDYPLIDDEYLSQLIAEDEERVVNDLATGWNIPAELVWDAVRELEGYFEWEQDYAYYAGNEEELHAKSVEIGQTWVAHYYGGVAHTPEVCGYCKEAKEVA